LRFWESKSVSHLSGIWRTEKLLRESNYQVLAVLEPIDVGISLSKIKKALFRNIFGAENVC